ncbi:MAG: EpsD family peptidyl-prolyl cis-trans isomerase [Pseudomonadota bacterium]
MQIQHIHSNLVRTAVLVALVPILVMGCSKKDKAPTQAVAIVDGQEISVHQINTVLTKVNGVTPDTLPKVKRDILEGLVEQQLAINLATANKLDRSPEVVTAIENAKREIIARAALEQIRNAQPKPTDEEAKAYFDAHPELFSQRRVFNLQEIAIDKATPNLAEVRSKVAVAKTIEEVAEWLTQKGIGFKPSAGARPAEQIPLEVLPKLHEFKDGQVGLIEGNDAHFIARVVASKTLPITEAQAIPRIKVFLANQRGVEAIKREKEAMKAKAKVEYLGEFAGGEAAFKAEAEAKAKAVTEAKAAAEAQAKAVAETVAKQKADDQAQAQADAEARSKARAEARASATKASAPANINLEQGIKGLK